MPAPDLHFCLSNASLWAGGKEEVEMTLKKIRLEVDLLALQKRRQIRTAYIERRGAAYTFTHTGNSFRKKERKRQRDLDTNACRHRQTDVHTDRDI